MRRTLLLLVGLLTLGASAADARSTTPVPRSSHGPAWKIAYARDDGQGLNVVSSDERSGRWAIRSRTGTESLSWSHDGRHLAWSNGVPVWVRGKESQARGIYAADLDSGRVRHLSAGYDVDPAWSPDGRSIAFSRTDCVANPCIVGLYVVSSAGGKALLVKSGSFVLPGSPLSWSPDGRRLAGSGDLGLWVVGINGSGFRRIGSRADGEVGAPAWSPDAKLIAFGRHCYDVRGGDVFCDLAVIRPDGTGERQLEDDESVDSATHAPPTWSSEGVLLMESWRVRNTLVGVMAVDPATSARRRVYSKPVATLAAGSGGRFGVIGAHGLEILDAKGQRLLRTPSPASSDLALWVG